MPNNLGRYGKDNKIMILMGEISINQVIEAIEHAAMKGENGWWTIGRI